MGKRPLIPRWTLTFVFLLIFLFLFLPLCARLPLHALHDDSLASDSPGHPGPITTAIITGAKGTVEVCLSGEGFWRAVGAGFPLGEGDRIRTGKDSWAEIKLLHGLAPVGWVRLESGTEFRLEPVSAGLSSQVAFRTRLFLGRVYVKILQQLASAVSAFGPGMGFEVVTDAATVGVRGTLFSVYVSPPGVTGVCVQEGLVEVAAQGRAVLLEPGEETMVHPTMPPEPPGPMSPKERRHWQGAREWLEGIEGEIREKPGEEAGEKAGEEVGGGAGGVGEKAEETGGPGGAGEVGESGGAKQGNNGAGGGHGGQVKGRGKG